MENLVRYNIPDFDSWYDRGMSLAKNIVKVFTNSNNFTLTSYEGQTDFYEEYLTKYDEFVSVYKGEADLRGINVYDFKLIQAYLETGDRNGIMPAFSFKDKVLKEAYTIMCEIYSS